MTDDDGPDIRAELITPVHDEVDAALAAGIVRFNARQTCRTTAMLRALAGRVLGEEVAIVVAPGDLADRIVAELPTGTRVRVSDACTPGAALVFDAKRIPQEFGGPWPQCSTPCYSGYSAPERCAEVDGHRGECAP